MSKIGGRDGTPPSRFGVDEAALRRQGGTKEATQLEQEKKVTAIEAERLLSETGFVRTGGKRRNSRIDLGDASKAPIPLPEDDVDVSQWSLEGLDAAQSQFLRHAQTLKRGRGKRGGKLKGLLDLWQAVLEADGEDREDERKKELQALVEEVPPTPEAMAKVAHSVSSMFGVDVSEAPTGPQMVAASLLVAGEGQAVGPSGDGVGLDGDRLADGMHQMMDSGRRAVDDARSMTQGVNKNIAMHRTFVAKKR